MEFISSPFFDPSIRSDSIQFSSHLLSPSLTFSHPLSFSPPLSPQPALLLTDFHSTSTTPPYRAPELWDVYTGVTLGAASDAYAVGLVLFFMLFGKPAFEHTVGKVVLPAGVSHKSFCSELCLSLVLTCPGERMTLGEAREAVVKGRVPEKFREAVGREYAVELKTEAGEYRAGRTDNTSR